MPIHFYQTRPIAAYIIELADSTGAHNLPFSRTFTLGGPNPLDALAFVLRATISYIGLSSEVSVATLHVTCCYEPQHFAPIPPFQYPYSCKQLRNVAQDIYPELSIERKGLRHIRTGLADGQSIKRLK